MKNLKNNKTYIAIKNKVENGGRMPSVVSIHNLLNELGINHYFDGEVTNVVEYRSKGRRYVNSRHDGKVGKSLEFRALVINSKKSPFTDFGKESRSQWISMDSSSSYYSWNTYRYASDLLLVLDNYKNMTFEKR